MRAFTQLEPAPPPDLYRWRGLEAPCRRLEPNGPSARTASFGGQTPSTLSSTPARHSASPAPRLRLAVAAPVDRRLDPVTWLGRSELVDRPPGPRGPRGQGELRQEVVLGFRARPAPRHQSRRDGTSHRPPRSFAAAAGAAGLGRTLRSAAGSPRRAAPSPCERLRLQVALGAAMLPAHILVEVEPPLGSAEDRRAVAETSDGCSAGHRSPDRNPDELLLAEVAAHVLIFEDGAVLAEGSPESVLDRRVAAVRARARHRAGSRRRLGHRARHFRARSPGRIACPPVAVPPRRGVALCGRPAARGSRARPRTLPTRDRGRGTRSSFQCSCGRPRSCRRIRPRGRLHRRRGFRRTILVAMRTFVDSRLVDRPPAEAPDFFRLKPYEPRRRSRSTTRGPAEAD